VLRSHDRSHDGVDGAGAGGGFDHVEYHVHEFCDEWGNDHGAGERKDVDE